MKYWSTDASLIPCASSCRAAACWKAKCSQASNRSASALMASWRASPRAWRRVRRGIGSAQAARVLQLGRLRHLAVEGQTQFVGGNRDLFTVLDRAAKNHLGQRVLNGLLDRALEWPRAIGGVPALFRQPIACVRVERDDNLAVVEQLL